MTRQFLCILGLVGAGIVAGEAFGSDFAPVVGWDRQLFPSFIIASASTTSNVSRDTDEEGGEDEDGEAVATIGDRDGTLGIEIEAPEDNTKIEVSISADDWLNESTITAELPSAGQTYRVMPSLKYKFSALAKVTQTVPTTVTYRVKLNGKQLPERSETMVLHSINDCPYALRTDEGIQRIGVVYAAYVNEQHPFVDRILREALDTGVIDSFTGYQRGSDAEVLRQVYAVWDALSKRDIRYSSITKVAGVSETVYSQHVRLIDESINNGQANCVDGSVLIASILRKIDIEPILVMVPGHCYLAFALDKERTHIVALETTMIGNGATEEFEAIDELSELLDEETQESASYSSFCNAFHHGSNNLVECADKFESEDEPEYYELIPIAEARQRGVLPIAFQEVPGREFKSAP